MREIYGLIPEKPCSEHTRLAKVDDVLKLINDVLDSEASNQPGHATEEPVEVFHAENTFKRTRHRNQRRKLRKEV